MYPTVVIVLTKTQPSMTDICEISLPNANRVVSEAGAASAMDNEADSAVLRIAERRCAATRLGEGYSYSGREH